MEGQHKLIQTKVSLSPLIFKLPTIKNIILVLGMIRERIEFHPIPSIELSKILQDDTLQSLHFNQDTYIDGELSVDHSDSGMLGQGGFKTANLSHLALSPLAVSSLGQTCHQPVAVKRPYYRVKDRTSGYTNITRYTPALETSKIHKDANVHYWAHALLSSTYAFINRALSMSSEPPPFEIPRVCFVDAAVEITHSEGTTVQARSGKTKYSTVRSCYLVEELIKVDTEEEFVKYIHNSDAKPLPDPDDPHFPLVDFFIFT
ncbi:hypothetical protein PAXRUDRAFT_15849 [Paxillus rubicundulus Ve08.2h10]|uniref:Uncharacterized protein n=1 Tax=Paxillus rubicundulus Ve08.2h10 TaxID=930991 RepID=A0A0D0CBV9_9AGAM|nr:hypothetical protein PAXRUDRAFT_15849 [Paxillus rubicundulus Ve08.2h10]